MECEEEWEGRSRDALDFGLEALLFLGRALDGARVLCVRLEPHVACGALGDESEKEKGKRRGTYGGDGFVALAESLESAMRRDAVWMS